MEVMSSLLLWALVALFPQALVSGKQLLRRSATDLKFNNSLLIQQKSNKHKILLNLNGQPLVMKVTELQSVFGDKNCHECLNCMERALKAQKITNYQKVIKPATTELHNELISNGGRMREKRAVNTSQNQNNQKGEKRSKNKKGKVNKVTTVTKYNVDGEVQTLKVKESGDNGGTCEVYSVTKSYPCNSNEAEELIAATKRGNKKSKKPSDQTTVPPTTDKPHTAAIFRKRQVDNTQIPENVMPSIEEFY